MPKKKPISFLHLMLQLFVPPLKRSVLAHVSLKAPLLITLSALIGQLIHT